MKWSYFSTMSGWLNPGGIWSACDGSGASLVETESSDQKGVIRWDCTGSGDGCGGSGVDCDGSVTGCGGSGNAWSVSVCVLEVAAPRTGCPAVPSAGLW